MKKRFLALSALGFLLGILALSALADDSAEKYYGSKKSDKYHRPACRYVEKIKTENLVIFDSVQEAIDAGYEACKVCKPPKKDRSQEPQANYMLPEVLRCVKVIDGDTIKIESDGEVVSLRLIGINTPERGQKGYREARAFVKELCLDRRVRIEFDVDRTDRYKRLLGYVFVTPGDEQELFVNAELLREGHAKYFGFFNTERYDDFLKSVFCKEERGRWR